MVKGWHNEFERHSLARQGIKTGRKSSASNKAYVVPSVYNISGVGSNSSVGFAFRQGATIGKSGHLKIVDTPTETLLVGYGWAVYGARNKATGKVTFYKGWDKYSRTTSKQLSETGLRGADIVVDEKRELGGEKVVSHAKAGTIPTESVTVKDDGWRSHQEFPNSVYDTWASGEWEDAGEHKGSEVKKKIAFIQSVLKDAGIPSKVKTTETSNVFSQGVDVLVAPNNIERAKKILKERNF